VARDVHYADLRNEIPLTVYTSFYQETTGQVTFAVRTAGDPRAFGTVIRKTVHDIDPAVPIFNLRTQEEQVTQLVSSERLFATLTTFFGSVALGLTGIGLYGLLAQRVTMRTREIGIRMALGAQLRAVVTLVLGEGLRLTVIGLALGMGVTLGVTRFVSKMLFGVPPADPVTLGGAALLLVAIAAFACWLPARRAAKIDPMVALRAE
jgi:ABC-type antimicrobial peptide transport system permease subunit